MSNEEVLRKAIEKAVDNGWNLYKFLECEGEPTKWEVYDNGVLRVPLARGGSNMKTLESYIFNHDFAKALWGEEPEYGIKRYGNADKITRQDAGMFIPWQYHLQQMVIADNPIDYLKENI